MAEQRARAKADSQAKKHGHTDLSIYRDWVDNHPTEFIGYDELTAQSHVIGLLSDGKKVSEVSAGHDVEVILDASASMAQHRPRVESFLDFVADLYATLGIAAPHVRSLSVGGSVDASSRGMGGVGSVQVDPDARGRRIVVTDIPLETGRCECLVLSSPEIIRALAPHSGAPYFVPNGDAWNELLREDAAFTSQTLATMDPLLDWLAQPASSNASIGTSS